MNMQISTQSTQHSPASASEVAAACKVLFDAMPFRQGTKPENVAGAYLEALRGFSINAITHGIRKFMRGECENVSTKFIPTPPELASIVRTAEYRPVQHTKPRNSFDKDEEFREQSPREKARMRLKMPLYNHAMKTGQVAKVAEANSRGFEAMAVLAIEWGIPIPSELTDISSDQVEREWHRARNLAWSAIERVPPPFMCQRMGARQSA